MFTLETRLSIRWKVAVTFTTSWSVTSVDLFFFVKKAWVYFRVQLIKLCQLLIPWRLGVVSLSVTCLLTKRMLWLLLLSRRAPSVDADVNVGAGHSSSGEDWLGRQKPPSWRVWYTDCTPDQKLSANVRKIRKSHSVQSHKQRFPFHPRLSECTHREQPEDLLRTYETQWTDSECGQSVCLVSKGSEVQIFFCGHYI